MGGIKTFCVEEGGLVREANLQAIELPSDTWTGLRKVQDHLCSTLGFDVTAAQTVAWLLKQANFAVVAASAAMDREVQRLLLEPTAGKIHAIKYVREQTHMGLKEAKDYVESSRFHQR